MVGCSRHNLPSWMSAASRVDFDNLPRPAPGGDAAPPPPPQSPGHGSAADAELGFAERALSAAGAAFLSAIIVNPLDVAKVIGFETPA